MQKNPVLSMITLIQNYGSAISEEDLHALFPQKIKNERLKDELETLELSGAVVREKNLVFKDRENGYERNRTISRKMYDESRGPLKLFSYLPWVRFISLTGSNAFESCHEKDDIDLFVICAPDRLWIVYVMIVLLSKALGKRPFFCFNYLIDENNIAMSQKSYHNAVQLYMMKPLFNGRYKQRLFSENPWIERFMPNVKVNDEVEEFYRLRGDFKSRPTFYAPLNWLNSLIYKKYRRRIVRMFPEAINKGILLGRGMAKLHHNDKSTMYDEMLGMKG